MRLKLIFGAAALVTLTAPACADEPTFTRAEVEAAYAMGLADGNARAVKSSPAAQALAAKMQPATPAVAPPETAAAQTTPTPKWRRLPNSGDVNAPKPRLPSAPR